MHRVSHRRQFLSSAVAISIPFLGSGCGTILYPERRGQPAGCLDWKIVALDAVGLIFFFVPGVIAFAVDFNNGTIYLPPEECADTSELDDGQLAEIAISGDRCDVPAVEAAVSAKINKEVRLEPGRYQTQLLTDIREFWDIRSRFRGEV